MAIDNSTYDTVLTETLDGILANVKTTSVIVFDLPGDGTPSRPEGYTNDNMRVSPIPPSVRFVSVPQASLLDVEYYMQSIVLVEGRTVVRAAMLRHLNVPEGWITSGLHEEWEEAVSIPVFTRMSNWAGGLARILSYDLRQFPDIVPSGWIHGAELGVASWGLT